MNTWWKAEILTEISSQTLFPWAHWMAGLSSQPTHRSISECTPSRSDQTCSRRQNNLTSIKIWIDCICARSSHVSNRSSLVEQIFRHLEYGRVVVVHLPPTEVELLRAVGQVVRERDVDVKRRAWMERTDRHSEDQYRETRRKRLLANLYIVKVLLCCRGFKNLENKCAWVLSKNDSMSMSGQIQKTFGI